MASDLEHALRIFGECDTSIVSDALDRHGIDGVITGLEPVHPEHATVGRARPLRFERADTDGDGATNFPYAMLECITDGEVFVIDSPDPDLSCWGGLGSKLARNGGLNGVIAAGGYRDADDIRAGSFPVFGRGPTPKTSQRRMRVASTDAPVEVDGVTVAPGDVVVADATGIVVVPASDAEAVADAAEDILAEELLLERKIDAGATVADLRSEGREF